MLTISAALCWAILIEPTGKVWEVWNHPDKFVQSEISISVGTSRLFRMQGSADATMFVCRAPNGADQWAGRFKLAHGKLVLERTPDLPPVNEKVVCALMPNRVLVQSPRGIYLLDWKHGRWKRTLVRRVEYLDVGGASGAFNRAGTVVCMSVFIWSIMDSSLKKVLVIGVGSDKVVTYSRCESSMGGAVFSVGDTWQVFSFFGGFKIGGPPGYLYAGETPDIPHSHPILGVPRMEPARWTDGSIWWKGDMYGEPPINSEGLGQLCFSPLGGAICLDVKKSAVNINGRDIPRRLDETYFLTLVQP